MRCDQEPSLLTCAKLNCFDLDTCLRFSGYMPTSVLTPLQPLFSLFCTYQLKRSNVRELDPDIHMIYSLKKTEKIMGIPRIEVNEFVALTPMLRKYVTQSSHCFFHFKWGHSNSMNKPPTYLHSNCTLNRDPLKSSH